MPSLPHGTWEISFSPPPFLFSVPSLLHRDPRPPALGLFSFIKNDDGHPCPHRLPANAALLVVCNCCQKIVLLAFLLYCTVAVHERDRGASGARGPGALPLPKRERLRVRAGHQRPEGFRRGGGGETRREVCRDDHKSKGMPIGGKIKRRKRRRRDLVRFASRCWG